MTDDTTPADLERELGVDQRRIRHYLRQRYGHLLAYTDNWHLNTRAANDVRTHFRAERVQAEGSRRTASPASSPESQTPVLFRDATGSTAYDERGALRYLPGPGEDGIDAPS